ncbi:hypothetical protein Pcinc_011224 [Petrolisthes cinctipes]|uniref:Uncharacterized protein n=1 Tax=Petrolisthes cinctipes TaxID=88211 RepID=A0AAE1G401_PETCI|nr:hypothetical protein Pcinc_011224 [Petrolisthes cinctipes]
MISQTLLSQQPPRHSDYPLTARHPPSNMQIPGFAPRLSPGPAPQGTAPIRHPSSSEYHTAAPRPRTEALWAHVARRGQKGPQSATPQHLNAIWVGIPSLNPIPATHIAILH